ncbi:MAG: LemA family protein [Acholeplasma sp.]|nr:MAG: LemA family protein [Acholeplasma sp.]
MSKFLNHRWRTFMSKKYLGVAVFGFIVIVLAVMLITGYNGLVNLDEDIQAKYSQVENRLQERHDKIGQILGAVSGLQEHAETIYNAITAARAAYSAASSMDELIEADAAEAAAFTQLLVVVEDNPLITANAGYYALIDEISAMESALSVARRDYNEAVQDYNASIRRFPRVLYASMFGFERDYDYWKLNDGADEVPVIDFEWLDR